MTSTFKRKYFALATLLFIVKVVMAVFVNDCFVRPYVGGFLVVIFIYCFFNNFWNPPVKATAFAMELNRAS